MYATKYRSKGGPRLEGELLLEATKKTIKEGDSILKKLKIG